jgi:hypothetical protein
VLDFDVPADSETAMNADELRKRFPNASQSFLAQNSGQVAVAKRDFSHEPLAASEIPAPLTGRVHIRITSRRRRLIDPDNVYAKATVDCLRRAGIIRDDSEADISLETRQEKVGSKEPEETVIEIYEL